MDAPIAKVPPRARGDVDDKQRDDARTLVAAADTGSSGDGDGRWLESWRQTGLRVDLESIDVLWQKFDGGAHEVRMIMANPKNKGGGEGRVFASMESRSRRLRCSVEDELVLSVIFEACEDV